MVIYVAGSVGGDEGAGGEGEGSDEESLCDEHGDKVKGYGGR